MVAQCAFSLFPRFCVFPREMLVVERHRVTKIATGRHSKVETKLHRSSLETFAVAVRMCTTIPPSQRRAAPGKRESLKNWWILMGHHDLLKPVMFRVILFLACATNWPCTTPQFYSFILYIAFQFSKTVPQLQQFHCRLEQILCKVLLVAKEASPQCALWSQWTCNFKSIWNYEHD